MVLVSLARPRVATNGKADHQRRSLLGKACSFSVIKDGPYHSGKTEGTVAVNVFAEACCPDRKCLPRLYKIGVADIEACGYDLRPLQHWIHDLEGLYEKAAAVGQGLDHCAPEKGHFPQAGGNVNPYRKLWGKMQWPAKRPAF